MAPHVRRCRSRDVTRVPRTAEVVVVGAGIIGLFTAFHLARLGAGRITVLDAGRIGAQASS
ncbi:FAD-dependent oxidoreductase, partial [Actinomadura adrarensis]